jgi:hypothetical protein
MNIGRSMVSNHQSFNRRMTPLSQFGHNLSRQHWITVSIDVLTDEKADSWAGGGSFGSGNWVEERCNCLEWENYRIHEWMVSWSDQQRSYFLNDHSITSKSETTGTSPLTIQKVSKSIPLLYSRNCHRKWNQSEKSSKFKFEMSDIVLKRSNTQKESEKRFEIRVKKMNLIAKC